MIIYVIKFRNEISGEWFIWASIGEESQFQETPDEVSRYHVYFGNFNVDKYNIIITVFILIDTQEA